MDEMNKWAGIHQLNVRRFKCGFCGMVVGSDRGYFNNNLLQMIYICPHCKRPTYFEQNGQFPAPLLGSSVSNVPQEVESLYTEARVCTGAGAHTAAVLACRKLLMNIAVNQGAQEGKRFIEYVEYLADKGYVPPNGKIWVDHIRKKGNEATHEIALMNEKDAADLITFVEMLLRFIYEFPSKIKSE